MLRILTGLASVLLMLAFGGAAGADAPPLAQRCLRDIQALEPALAAWPAERRIPYQLDLMETLLAFEDAALAVPVPGLVEKVFNWSTDVPDARRRAEYQQRATLLLARVDLSAAIVWAERISGPHTREATLTRLRGSAYQEKPQAPEQQVGWYRERARLASDVVEAARLYQEAIRLVLEIEKNAVPPYMAGAMARDDRLPDLTQLAARDPALARAFIVDLRRLEMLAANSGSSHSDVHQDAVFVDYLVRLAPLDADSALRELDAHTFSRYENAFQAVARHVIARAIAARDRKRATALIKDALRRARRLSSDEKEGFWAQSSIGLNIADMEKFLYGEKPQQPLTRRARFERARQNLLENFRNGHAYGMYLSEKEQSVSWTVYFQKELVPLDAARAWSVLDKELLPVVSGLQTGGTPKVAYFTSASRLYHARSPSRADQLLQAAMRVLGQGHVEDHERNEAICLLLERHPAEGRRYVLEEMASHTAGDDNASGALQCLLRHDADAVLALLVPQEGFLIRTSRGHYYIDAKILVEASSYLLRHRGLDAFLAFAESWGQRLPAAPLLPDLDATARERWARVRPEVTRQHLWAEFLKDPRAALPPLLEHAPDLRYEAVCTLIDKRHLDLAYEVLQLLAPELKLDSLLRLLRVKAE
ncbi:MAG: hypothetical protein FJX76_11760 [Armatimonadetes bacterium]|nr:hypothetical protein [Armatimonadota bacterium]